MNRQAIWNFVTTVAAVVVGLVVAPQVMKIVNKS